MNLPPIKPHYQRFPVQITTQQRPGKIYTLEVVARNLEQAVDSTKNGGALDISPCLKARGFIRPQFKSYRC